MENPDVVFLRRLEACRGVVPAVVFRNCPDRPLPGVKRYYDTDGGPKAIYFVPVEGQIRQMPATVSDDVILGIERKAVADPVAQPFRGFIQQRTTGNC